MTRSEQLSQWQATVSTHMPHLSKPHAAVLALWSFGMVLAQRGGVTSVAVALAPLLGRHETTVRQRVREWCYDSPQKTGVKRGIKRQEVDVTTCFVPLIRWILAWWPADERRLALAMDASTLGQRVTVLAISLIYRGCAIPGAWVVVPATAKGSWRPHWERVLAHIQPGIPLEWPVIVLADRGLYAQWLCQHIVHLGWHPFLRVHRGGHYRPVGAARFRPLAEAVTKGGPGCSGRVTCFSSRDAQLDCTLLARWDEQSADPWLILTDLPPDGADVVWYGLRCHVECGFKDTKRGGWHWEQTKMRDPRRAERLWLAMAVATLWVVSVGGATEIDVPASGLDDIPLAGGVRRRPTTRSRPRLLSCFRRGVLVIVATLSAGLPIGRFVPEPWPETLDTRAAHGAAHEPLRYAA